MYHALITVKVDASGSIYCLWYILLFICINLSQDTVTQNIIVLALILYYFPYYCDHGSPLPIGITEHVHGNIKQALSLLKYDLFMKMA